ncbi:hypothetical protein WK58_09295 [Burkholderia ubonensis]|nr:hypothetical protein WK58_09295 [Burkholderia ubonensis]
MVSGGGNRGYQLKAGTMTMQTSFQCATTTTYALILDPGTEQGHGIVTMSNSTGAMVSVMPRIRSIDGKPVNIYFKDLPASGYKGEATGGKVYQVAIDLVPTAVTKSGNASASGLFTGNFRLQISY